MNFSLTGEINVLWIMTKFPLVQNMLEFLEKAEDKFNGMGAIAGDIEAIKGQINQLHKFKDEVDPHMVKVEALNR